MVEGWASIPGVTDKLEHAGHAHNAQRLSPWPRIDEQAGYGSPNHQQVQLVPAQWAYVHIRRHRKLEHSNDDGPHKTSGCFPPATHHRILLVPAEAACMYMKA